MISCATPSAGRLTEKWLPNGVNTRYQYNPDNTLAQVANRVHGEFLITPPLAYETIHDSVTSSRTDQVDPE